jgi:hypothetical protein
VVDRRFNHRKYNATKTVALFSGQLREEIDPDTLSAELLAVVDQTTQPHDGVALVAAITAGTRAHRVLNCPRGVLGSALLASTRPSSWTDAEGPSRPVLAHPGVSRRVP